jgi:hypothetical protein
MIRLFWGITFVAFFVGLTGCSSAGLGNMKEVSFENEITSDMAMINIVRWGNYSGDGPKVELWDGEAFIGSLGPGRLLQYKVIPGNHIFMVSAQGAWGVARGDMEPGKTYYLKVNITGWGPMSLGAAKSDDPRIEKWNKMKTVTIDKAVPKAIPEKVLVSVRSTLKRVEEGRANVTPITENNAL